MSSYLNIFTGNLVSPSQVPYNTFVLNGNLTLSWSTSYGSNPSPNIIAYFNNVSAVNNNYSLILPEATQVGTGLTFYINNSGNYKFNLVANDGKTVISTISAPSLNLFILTSNSTTNGTWLQAPLSGSTAVTSVSVSTAATNGNLTSSGSPIINVGTINIGLGADLAGITSLGSNTGIAIRTAASGTWSTTSIMGTPGQVSIVNGNGISGSPTLSLPNAISGIGSIALNAGGNLSFGVTANTIASNNLNGNIYLQPNGTGSIYLNNGGTGTTYATTISLGFLDFTSVGAGSAGITVFCPASGVTSYSIELPATIGTSGQVMKINTISGSTAVMAWSTPGTGTVTAITAGTNLTGGTITSSGTISLSSTVTGLTSIGVQNIISNPTQSLSVPGLVLGTPYENSLGYDITMCVILDITVNGSGANFIAMGISPTSSVIVQTVFTGSTATGLLPLTVRLSAGYWVSISTSGLTASIVGQYAVPN
jgi:hypothetical protein